MDGVDDFHKVAAALLFDGQALRIGLGPALSSAGAAGGLLLRPGCPAPAQGAALFAAGGHPLGVGVPLFVVLAVPLDGHGDLLGVVSHGGPGYHQGQQAGRQRFGHVPAEILQVSALEPVQVFPELLELPIIAVAPFGH